MDTAQTPEALAARYEDCVAREREAWQTLQSFSPGSAERHAAWQAWSDSIVQTNAAWRRLSASRLARPRIGVPANDPQHHARA